MLSQSPVSSTSRAAVHLFRLNLENVCLLLLQNGSRIRRWQGLLWPAMLPTTRRPTGTLRQDPQCPTQWDKNVRSCHFNYDEMKLNQAFSPVSISMGFSYFTIRYFRSEISSSKRFWNSNIPMTDRLPRIHTSHK